MRVVERTGERTLLVGQQACRGFFFLVFAVLIALQERVRLRSRMVEGSEKKENPLKPRRSAREDLPEKHHGGDHEAGDHFLRE